MMQWLHNALTQSWVYAKMIGVILLAGLILEALRPAERGQPRANIAFNIGYIAFLIPFNTLLMPAVMGLMQPIVQRYGLHIPIAFPDATGWQILQTLVFFFIHDFFYYWFHRGQHTLAFAWPQHKLHHSERSVNVTTTLRHHWLEDPIRAWVILLPMGLLFDQKPVTIGWLAMAANLFGYFVHLNVRLPLGQMTPLIAGPQWHRLHHSIEPQHTDRNFAAFFPIFDILFGTYAKPGRDEYPATGLHSGESLNSPLLAILSPFRDWYRMFRRDRPPALAQDEQGAVNESVDEDGDSAGQQDERQEHRDTL
ncbi:MAG: sterol desaturase family protein [Dokdonella sp.]|uniref:sterol desaturase family protein n=1 Tax=Dokdonella sp. TaxID=2291710 RepID=UPI003BB0C1D1